MSWQQRAQQAIEEIKSAKTESASLQAFLNLNQVRLENLNNEFCKEMVRLNFLGLITSADKLNANLVKKISSVMLFNMSGESMEICKDILDKKFHLQLVKALKSVSVADANRYHLNEEVHEVIEYTLGTLFNVLEQIPESRAIIRKTGIYETLIEFLGLLDPSLRYVVVFTLPYLVDWSCKQSNQVLMNSKLNIGFLLNDMLAQLTTESDKTRILTCGELESHIGFRADEVLQPLSYLAKSKQNSIELLKEGVIAKCEVILIRAAVESFNDDKSSMSNLGSKWALNLLDCISTHGMCDELINFDELLFKYQSHPIQEIAEVAETLLKKIQLKGNKTSQFGVLEPSAHSNKNFKLPFQSKAKDRYLRWS